MPSLRPTTKTIRDLLQEMREEFTVAEYEYLLMGTDESLMKYRQARAYISYFKNIQAASAA